MQVAKFIFSEVMLLIAGISHITLVVQDLERTAILFENIFEAKEVYRSSTAKYFLVGNIWIALNKGSPLSERSYNHIAFAIQDEDFDKYVERINSLNVETVPGRKRDDGEGRSVYFYDYDNHLFELHTGTLEERLKTYL